MPEKNTFGIYEKTRKYTYTMGVFSIFDFYKYENTKSIFLFIEIFTVVKGEILSINIVMREGGLFLFIML
jgi:hypothetical protein